MRYAGLKAALSPAGTCWSTSPVTKMDGCMEVVGDELQEPPPQSSDVFCIQNMAFAVIID